MSQITLLRVTFSLSGIGISTRDLALEPDVTARAARAALANTSVVARARVRLVALLVGLGFSLVSAGCRVREPSRDAGPNASATAPSPAPRTSSPPAAAGSTAAGSGAVEVAFGDGRARFFVPQQPTPEKRLPLLVLLHGLGGSGAEIARDFGLDAFAARKGFVYVAPDGTLDRMERRFWNAGRACCNFFNAPVDDVARLHALIEHAIRELPVDPKRVFIVGYSNGGFMAHRLACERSESIAAVVSMAAIGPQDECGARAAVSILEIHGDRDPIVPFAGGHLFGRPEMPRVPELKASLAPWLAQNGCKGGFRQVERLDLVSDIAGVETDVLRPSQCAAAPVELWAVRGGSHYLALGQPAFDKVWEFLSLNAARSPAK